MVDVSPNDTLATARDLGEINFSTDTFTGNTAASDSVSLISDTIDYFTIETSQDVSSVLITLRIHGFADPNSQQTVALSTGGGFLEQRTIGLYDDRGTFEGVLSSLSDIPDTKDGFFSDRFIIDIVPGSTLTLSVTGGAIVDAAPGQIDVGLDLIDHPAFYSFAVSVHEEVSPESLVTNGSESNDNLMLGSASDTVNGLGGDDFVDGGAGNDTIRGGDGDDQLVGGLGNDVLVGDNGNDTVLGGAGDDQIFAGQGDTGNDTVNGGSDNDIIGGGAGDDNLLGGNGNDLLFGGSGNDTLNGQSGDDIAWAGSGNDVVYGADGSDTLGGGFGDDSIYGNDGADTIFGAAGDDELMGGGGGDTIFGGSDNDTIIGGDGNDEMFGGAGNDTFIMLSNFGDDTIGGFKTLGINVIDLSDLSLTSFNNLVFNQAGNDLQIDTGSGTILLYNAMFNEIASADFLF